MGCRTATVPGNDGMAGSAVRFEPSLAELAEAFDRAEDAWPQLWQQTDETRTTGGSQVVGSLGLAGLETAGGGDSPTWAGCIAERVGSLASACSP